MKLLIVTCLEADKHTASKLLQRANINIFSVTETTGYKRNNGLPNMLDNWFGSHNAEFSSVFFFSFTSNANAEQAVEAIDRRNTEQSDRLPIHAFVVAVENQTIASV